MQACSRPFRSLVTSFRIQGTQKCAIHCFIFIREKFCPLGVYFTTNSTESLSPKMKFRSVRSGNQYSKKENAAKKVGRVRENAPEGSEESEIEEDDVESTKQNN